MNHNMIIKHGYETDFLCLSSHKLRIYIRVIMSYQCVYMFMTIYQFILPFVTHISMSIG